MTRPRVYKTKAIILKRTRLGEADSILTFYTPYLGKLRAVAKGVLRPQSKMGGPTELLTHSTMLLSRGQNLDIITQSQTLEGFFPLRDDLWGTAYALYAVELVDRFTPEGLENYPLFRLLLNTLRGLCQAHNGELILHHFELHLLDCLGYRPQLQRCIYCSSLLQPTASFFSPGSGGVLCPACRTHEVIAYPLSPGALKALRWLQMSDWTAAGRLKLSPELSLELEKVIRGYIRHLLEREVKSAEWLDRLRREGIHPYPEIRLSPPSPRHQPSR